MIKVRLLVLKLFKLGNQSVQSRDGERTLAGCCLRNPELYVYYLHHRRISIFTKCRIDFISYIDDFAQCLVNFRNDRMRVLWTLNGRLTHPLIRIHLFPNTSRRPAREVWFPLPTIETRCPNRVTEGFESPAKTSFGNTSAAPAPQFRNPSFTTPRKPFDQEFFSEVSGAESSPADNTDADAEDTPDPKSITRTMTAIGINGPSKAPLFGRYGNGFTGNSPSRADRRQGKYGNAILNKARKRKRIDRDHALITRNGSDSESEGEERVKETNLHNPKSWFGNLLDGIDARPNLPNILSYYAQLIMNFTLVFAFIYLLYCFWQGVRGDVDKASDEVRSVVLAEMATCANEYTINGCYNKNRAPALDKVCNAWELCMNKDPDGTGRAKISAKTFAEIFNSFVEPISWKAMVC